MCGKCAERVLSSFAVPFPHIFRTSFCCFSLLLAVTLQPHLNITNMKKLISFVSIIMLLSSLSVPAVADTFPTPEYT